jgi:hypothetical protein
LVTCREYFFVLTSHWSQAKMGAGLRWKLPQWLLGAVTAAWDGNLTKDITESRAATGIIAELFAAFRMGLEERRIQAAPHPVLLDREYYHKSLRPPLTRWALLWLHEHGAVTVASEVLLEYLTAGPRGASQATLTAVIGGLPDDCVKALNLLHDWLSTLLPHCLSKVNRVTFGLLRDKEVSDFVAENPHMTKNRRLLAIPFIGKDCPSRTNEFSHPDVGIGLTILSFRYGGLRRTDVQSLLLHLQQEMRLQAGPHAKRPACVRYRQWVESAGARVRGPTTPLNPLAFATSAPAPAPANLRPDDSLNLIQLDDDDDDDGGVRNCGRGGVGGRAEDNMGEKGGLPESVADEGIWPLELMNLADPEHVQVAEVLLARLPHAMEYYLDAVVFPLTMQNQPLKLSASGHDLGGRLLFGRCLGFSGTPSDLLPLELGRCVYEKGSDGKMLHLMTDPSVVTLRTIPPLWAPLQLLKAVARARPTYHALIDSGALVTGVSNLQAARILLQEGLAEAGFEGVVFLTDEGDQLLLKAAGMLVVPLAESGVSDPRKRFTFYDQVHTTGIDVRQGPGVVAAITLGKDMTWRDFTQGAWRMRGLEIGQRVEVLVTPEVARLVTSAAPPAPPFPSTPDAPGGWVLKKMKNAHSFDRVKTELVKRAPPNNNNIVIGRSISH